MLRVAVPRVFYRVIQGPQPTAADFRSARELGKLAPSPEALWDGLSVYATEQQARKKAVGLLPRGSPIGDFIVKLEIADDIPIIARRTLSSPGHHTLWGRLDLLVNCVTDVVPVLAVQ